MMGYLQQVACVIPARNEADTIAEVAARTRRHLRWVIVVDDGSVDGTADRLKGLAVTLLRNPSPRGKAASVVLGARVAIADGAQAIITLDGDGQHCPDEIPRVIDAAKDHPLSIIIAARVHGRSAAPIIRRFANRFADFWVSWAAGYPIADSQSGFRLYPKEAFECARDWYDPRSGFVLESEILIDAARHGCYSIGVPVDAIYHPRGRASYYRPIVDTLRITRMVAWELIKQGFNPIALFRSLGLVSHPVEEAGGIKPWGRSVMKSEQR